MNAIHRVLAALGAMLTAGCLLAAPALAWSNELEGRPQQHQPGGPEGYYIWHNDSGLHVATTDPSGSHHYTAKIETDGLFQNVELVRPESDDKATIADSGHTLYLNFRTYEGIDGVNFNIQGGKGMRLALHIDGSLAPTGEIYIGQDGDHPGSNPFTEVR